MMDMERLFADANKGVLPALSVLGDMYLNGYEESGIKPDLNKAIEYYEKAADGGMESAMMQLGYIYCSGEHMQPDYEKGIGYYMRAADLGNTTALGNLGLSYIKGYGVEKDEKKGFEYFLKAAEGGHPKAMHQVALLYRDGVGVEKDEEKFRYWEECSEKAEEQEKENNNDKSPVQEAFEKNLKFISADSLDLELVKSIFGDNKALIQYNMGECEFKSGKIITADPLCYLQDSKNVLIKAKK